MLIITVRVVPNAKKRNIIVDTAGRLKLYVVSQPEKGKANTEIVAYLAKQLGVSKSCVEIVKGFSERTKTIAIHADIDRTQLYQALGLPIQSIIDS